MIAFILTQLKLKRKKVKLFWRNFRLQWYLNYDRATVSLCDVVFLAKTSFQHHHKKKGVNEGGIYNRRPDFH